MNSMNDRTLTMLSSTQIDNLIYAIGGVDIAIAVATGTRLTEPAKKAVLNLPTTNSPAMLNRGSYQDFPDKLVSPLIQNLGGLGEAHAIASGVRLVATAGRVLVNGCNFDPMVHIGQSGWSLTDKTDYNAANLKTINFHEFGVEFLHCVELADDNGLITGEEKYKRLKDSGHILLGTGALLALWNEKCRETLKWLSSRGINQIDFFGDILKSPMGNECVPTLQCDNRGNWTIVCRRLDLPFSRTMYAAIIKRSN